MCTYHHIYSKSGSNILDYIIVVTGSSLQTDLGRRKVDESEGRLWAETKGFHYFETSAQSNTNIQEMFEMLVQSVVGVITSKEQQGGRLRTELGYTPEQAALVSRIRSCHDNYDILKVPRTCSRLVLFDINTIKHSIFNNLFFFCFRDEINKSYKQLAVLLHPDKNLAPGSEEAFKAIARAREELLRTR